MGIYHRRSYVIYIIIVFAILCYTFSSVRAQSIFHKDERKITILHTNDIHGHIRSDINGVGGLPFVSGYIHHYTTRDDNVLILDAGDVAAKGDLLAEKTHSKATFQAMSQIGYNAWTPGNHDLDLGIDALQKYSKTGMMDRLCINLLKADGSPVFKSAKIYEIDGVRVGVIGATLPGHQPPESSYHVMNLQKTGRAIAKESQRLKPQTDLIVVLAHIPPNDCKKISKIAPDIDVFVSGHSHEAIKKPIRVAGTGAIILQAGCYAHYVGRLKLTLNIKEHKIDSYSYKLVAMDHNQIIPDIKMMEWIRKKELKIVPDAQEIVAWAPRKIKLKEVGALSADAERKATGAEIAFNDGIKVLRQGFPFGKLDVNTIYRAAGQRGQQLIKVDLLGSEINNYVQGLVKSTWHQTQWSGFRGKIEKGRLKINLLPDKQYEVVMTQREWKKRFTGLFDRVRAKPGEWPGIAAPGRKLHSTTLKTTWSYAMFKLLKEWNKDGIGLLQGLHNIAKQTGQNIDIMVNKHTRSVLQN